MIQIQPIQTLYNGYRFRSRLEARWAVFFDSAGIEYQYEPEGFELRNGLYYLPDFYLPKVGGRLSPGIFVEVKAAASKEDEDKILAFYDNTTDHDVDPYGKGVYVVSSIPKDYWEAVEMSEMPISGSSIYPYNFETLCCDHYTALFYKNKDDSVGIWGPDHVESFDGFEWFTPHYLKARQARFEHGEKG